MKILIINGFSSNEQGQKEFKQYEKNIKKVNNKPPN